MSNVMILTVFMIMLAKISQRFLSITFAILILSGVFIWSFHPVQNEHTNLLGASALIFGLLGYILLRIVLNKDLLDSLEYQNCVNSYTREIALNAWISFVIFSIIVIYVRSSVSGAIVLGEGVLSYGHVLGLISGIVVYIVELILVVLKRQRNSLDK